MQMDWLKPHPSSKKKVIASINFTIPSFLFLIIVKLSSGKAIFILKKVFLYIEYSRDITSVRSFVKSLASLIKTMNEEGFLSYKMYWAEDTYRPNCFDQIRPQEIIFLNPRCKGNHFHPQPTLNGNGTVFSVNVTITTSQHHTTVPPL